MGRSHRGTLKTASVKYPRYLVFAETLHRCDTLAAALDCKAKYGGTIFEPLGMTTVEKVNAEDARASDKAEILRLIGQLDKMILSCYFRTKAGYLHWQQGSYFGTSTHKNTEAEAYLEAIGAIRHNAGLDADCPNCGEQPEGQYAGPCPDHQAAE